jgi:hypothetical protein
MSVTTVQPERFPGTRSNLHDLNLKPGSTWRLIEHGAPGIVTVRVVRSGSESRTPSQWRQSESES